MTAQLDDIDLKILRELRANARLSNRELAERVGLSPSPCWTRLRRLEQAGVIQGYVAVYDPVALGTPDIVIIYITLERHDDEQLAKFESALAELPEVIEAYLLTGDFDYFIKVAVAGTSGYERFLRDKLYRIPGIRHTRSSFTLRCLKQTYGVQPPEGS